MFEKLKLEQRLNELELKIGEQGIEYTKHATDSVKRDDQLLDIIATLRDSVSELLDVSKELIIIQKKNMGIT